MKGFFHGLQGLQTPIFFGFRAIVSYIPTIEVEKEAIFQRWVFGGKHFPLKPMILGEYPPDNYET